MRNDEAQHETAALYLNAPVEARSDGIRIAVLTNNVQGSGKRCGRGPLKIDELARSWWWTRSFVGMRKPGRRSKELTLAS